MARDQNTRWYLIQFCWKMQSAGAERRSLGLSLIGDFINGSFDLSVRSRVIVLDWLHIARQLVHDRNSYNHTTSVSFQRGLHRFSYRLGFRGVFRF